MQIIIDFEKMSDAYPWYKHIFYDSWKSFGGRKYRIIQCLWVTFTLITGKSEG